MRRNKLCELQIFLNQTKNGVHDNNWLFQARRVFRDTTEGRYNVTVLADLVEQVEKFRKCDDFWKQTTECFELSREDICGVKEAVKYGVTLGLLSASGQCEENLCSLLRQFYVSWNVEEGSFCGFPWILGVVFVICSGNIEKYIFDFY